MVNPHLADAQHAATKPVSMKGAAKVRNALERDRALPPFVAKTRQAALC